MSWKHDLNYGLEAFGIRIPESLPVDSLVGRLTGQPARNTAALVAASSAIFFIAERDHNPKVNDIYDAMVYCSTCLSVGYGDIFAHTPIGKLIGTTLMTVGPSLSGRVLDANADALQEQVLATLGQILNRLPDSR